METFDYLRMAGLDLKTLPLCTFRNEECLEAQVLVQILTDFLG